MTTVQNSSSLLQAAAQLWKQKQFDGCFKLLSTVKESGEVHHKYTLLVLIREHNILACKSQIPHSNIADYYNVLLQGFESLFEKTTGTVVTKITKQIVDICLHNSLVIWTLLNDSQFDHREQQTQLDKWSDVLVTHQSEYGNTNVHKAWMTLLKILNKGPGNFHENSGLPTIGEIPTVQDEFLLLPASFTTKSLNDIAICKQVEMNLWQLMQTHNLQACQQLLVNIDGTTQDAKVWCEIVQAYLYWKVSDYKKCFDTIAQSPPMTEGPAKGRLLNLKASCLSQQGKYQLAIQTYQQALIADSNFLVPLLNISLQYRQMKQIEAELDTLDLLVRAVQVPSSETPSFPPQISPLTSQEEVIDLSECLYLLAKRSLQLRRFTQAVQAYSKLIVVLRGSSSYRPVQTLRPSPVVLPHLLVIYTEMAYSLLQCGEFADCRTVCESALRACNASSADIEALEDMEIDAMLAGDSPDTTSQPRITRNQMNIPMSSQLESLECSTHCFMYTAECLASQGKLQEALTPINNALMQLQMTKVIDKNAILAKVSDLLNNKALVLHTLGHHSEALGTSREAVTTNPRNLEALYNHCVLLMEAGRIQEACRNWLTKRGFDLSLDANSHMTTLNQLFRDPSSQDDSSWEVFDKDCVVMYYETSVTTS